MPSEWVPCPSFLGLLAVSPLHGIACSGTAPSCILHCSGSVHHPLLPRSLPGQQQPSPGSMAQTWQPTLELVSWHSCSGFCMCSHDPTLPSPGVLRRPRFLLLLTLPLTASSTLSHSGSPSWKLSRKKPALHHHLQAASRHGPLPASCHVSSVTPCILFLLVPLPPAWSQAGPGPVVHSTRKYFETLVTAPEGYRGVWGGAHGVWDWDW